MTKALILAAGRGERMRPLTDALPKPLIPVRGQPLIERHLQQLRAAGVREFVINLGWQGQRLREALGDGARFDASIRYSEEGWPALETGGGIRHALPLLGEAPFVMVNGDVYADYPWAPLVARAGALPAGLEAHLVLVPNPPFLPEGDFTLADGRAGNAAQHRFTFSGISIQRPQMFAAHAPGRFKVLPLWRAAAERGALGAELYQGRWSDVGTLERLAALERELAAG